jgi:hypothetical protein
VAATRGMVVDVVASADLLGAVRPCRLRLLVHQ